MKFYMLVLSLDTTTREGSAALMREGVLLGTWRGDAAVTHGERLPGDLIRLLSAHAARLADVDLFAVAAGPGSFTGLRVGIATLQGLALANTRPLVGVSALDALNEAARPALRSLPTPLPGSERAGVEGGIAAWIDAQRGQVFSALYYGEDLVEAPVVEKPADVLARWARCAVRPRLFAGDGALQYAALIENAFPDAHILRDRLPLAPAVARLAEAHLREHGPRAPDAIRPIYIRPSDAELARDRAARLNPDPAAAS
jgi:tRNA threonylcarbamoyladenosine biosynthesis protein TsaB